jgi:hypothetical protein
VFLGQLEYVGLFGFLLLLQTFYLAPLLLDLSLLRFYLGLSLLRLHLLILEGVTEQEPTACPQRASYGGTGPGSADRRPDYGAGRRTSQRADSRTLFACAQRLAGTTGNRKQHHQRDGDSD